MPLLGSIQVSEIMARPRVVFIGRNSVAEGAAKLERENLPGAPVVDERGAFIGVVGCQQLMRAAQDNPKADISRLADPTAPTISTAARLDAALEALVTSDANWVPVLDQDRQVVGILSTEAVVRGYRASLRNNLRLISGTSEGTVVIDSCVAEGSPCAGRPLGKIGFPAGTIVMTLQRGSELILPRGDTVLEAGDQLGILAHGRQAARVAHLLESPAGPDLPNPPSAGGNGHRTDDARHGEGGGDGPTTASP
ncbi:MAG: CBS domain-containing protein [Acidimicrobiales bacterium]